MLPFANYAPGMLVQVIRFLCLTFVVTIGGDFRLRKTAEATEPVRFSATDDAGISFREITRASGISGFRHRGGALSKPYLPDTVGSGLALLDYDNDGWLDIYLLSALSHAGRKGEVPPESAALFRNNHDGTFSDVTAEAGVANERWGVGVCAGDFDNDGWVDLFVANLGQSRVYQNRGGKFSDVTHLAGIDVNTWATGCAFGDYDKDGLLDLYVAAYVEFDWDRPPPSGSGEGGYRDYGLKAPAFGETTALRTTHDHNLGGCTYQGVRVACGPQGLNAAKDFLFRNIDGRTFKDVSAVSGVRDVEARYGFAVAWVDVDNDGWLDLVVANDGSPNFLFHNNTDGHFEEVGLLSGLGTSGNGRAQAYMGMAVGDYNHDGQADFYFTTFSAESYTLYRNEGGGTFTDVTLQAGLGQVTVPLLGWGAEFLDYDNDSWLDLVTANGHIYPQVDQMQWNTSYKQPGLLLRNVGNGRFEEASGKHGDSFSSKRSSRGLAVGDLFNDGDIDMVFNNLDDGPTLLSNVGGNRAARWITLKLVGDPSQGTPRDAIGSVVYCTAGGIRQRGEVASGRGYLSQSDFRVHFGLGSAPQIDRLEVVWANGSRQTYEVTELDRIMVLNQNEPVGQQ